MYRESGCTIPFNDILRIRGQLEWENVCGLHSSSITKEISNLLTRDKRKLESGKRVNSEISNEELDILKVICKDLNVSMEGINTVNDLQLMIPDSTRNMCRDLIVVLGNIVRSISCKKEMDAYGTCPEEGFEYKGIKYRLFKDLYEDYNIPYGKEDLKRDLDWNISSKKEYLEKVLIPIIMKKGYNLKPFIVDGVKYTSKYLFVYGVLKLENDYDRYYYYDKIKNSKLEFSTAVERDCGFYVFGSLYFSLNDVIRDYKPIIGSYNDKDSLYKKLISFSESIRSKGSIIEDYIRLKAYNMNVEAYGR